MVFQLLVMSGVLAASTFAVGMLPLSYTFSKGHLERLSALGTGLLLGAALGVIIPEGIETVIEASPKEVPTGRIALSLIIGFVLMLIIEQLISPNAHSLEDMPLPLHSKAAVSTMASVEFDAEMAELEHNQNQRASENQLNSPASGDMGLGKERAFTLLLGLVFHGCADGLALGVANLAQTTPGSTNTVSFVVFLALALHKAPTSLAFTTSLISTSLPRPNCKKYLSIFSLSTPLVAILSYFSFSFFGDGDKTDLIGIALLVSGGTFLYVATVLQPVSHHSPSAGELRPIARVFFITSGMFIPLMLSSVIGHGH